MINVVVEKATGKFLSAGPCDFVVDKAVHTVVQMDSFPDQVAERYDGTSPTLRRAVTQGELDVETVARKDTAALSEADAKAIKAVLQWLVPELNKIRVALVPPKPPLTGVDVRTDIIANLKALL